MFKITSLRRQGTMVEVVKKGVELLQAINGFGSIESERLTPGIKTQEKLKFISVNFTEEALKEASTDKAADLEVTELKETDTSDKITYSASALKRMRKDELYEVAVEKGILVSDSDTKKDIISLILEYS